MLAVGVKVSGAGTAATPGMPPALFCPLCSFDLLPLLAHAHKPPLFPKTPKAYFKTGWNRFDFGIVVLSTILFIVELSTANSPVGLFATIVRGLRLARIVKTHTTFKKVKRPK